MNGVGCLHLIIITADINENQVMCIMPYNEWQGGQIPRKCYEKLGDGQTTKLRGEAVLLTFQPNSVYSCILWLKSPKRPGYFKTMSGEEWLLSRTPVGAQDTRQP